MSNEPDFEPVHPDDPAAPRFAPARPLSVRAPDLQDSADWPQSAPPGPGAGAILHGLRRRWFAALLVGLICCGLSAAAAWFYLEPQFVAEGYLRVESKEPSIISENQRAASDFDVYKRTQRELILSGYVLNAALRDKDDKKISQIPLLLEQDDPIAWLARQIRVDYPGNAEILRISLKGDHPQHLRDIVNAVIDAYLLDATKADKDKRETRVAALEKALIHAENSLGTKRKEIRDWIAQYGDGNVLPMEQADVLRQHQDLLDQLHAVRLDQVLAQTARDVAESRVKQAHEAVVPQAALDPAIDREPSMAALRQQVIQAEATLAEANRTANKAKNLNYIKDRESKVELARAELARHRDSVRANLAPQLAQQFRDKVTSELAAAQDRVSLLAAQLTRLAEQEEQLARQVKGFAKPPLQMALAQDELRPMLDILADLSRQLFIERAEQTAIAEAEEQARLREISAPQTQRVTLIQLAEIPRYKDTTSQVQATVALAVLGLLLPIFAIAWCDARSRRVNSSAEVNHLLGMRVIGSLPMLPDPSRRLLGRLETRTAHWRVALRESIDGVRTMLLRETDLAPTRVVLVTSAVSGEGKTSLATQLAVSFARARCRTLLVDFDLRRPAAHRVFSSPLGPGVCDLLRGQALLPDCIRPTRAANLSLLPAGGCDDQSLAALARPELGELFDQLKADFDFVIVDCSPVLPVVDALLVGRHVDAALFSVLRDVSQAPKIQAAHDRLTALGIRVLGTVVTGKDDISYRADYRYQPQT